MTEDTEDTYLNYAGWGPPVRDSLFVALARYGWKVDKIYGGTAHLRNGDQILHLDLMEESVAVTYKANSNMRARGGSVLRSGRASELLAISINELVASFQ